MIEKVSALPKSCPILQKAGLGSTRRRNKWAFNPTEGKFFTNSTATNR